MKQMKKRLIAVAVVAAVALAVVPAALAAAGPGGGSGGGSGRNGGGGGQSGPGQNGSGRAQNGGGRRVKGRPFACKGIVVSVDTTAGSLLVTVRQGSIGARPCLGQQETFTLGPRARVFLRTVDADGSIVLTPASLAQVAAGDRVAIDGSLVRTDQGDPVFTARNVLASAASQPVPTPTPTDSPAPAPSEPPLPAA